MPNFWKQLQTPFFVLAPMYDVTDVAFREMFAMYGKPDVMFTEFVSTDGLASSGRERLMHHLRFTENQRPMVAQVFGAHPDKFAETAELLTSLKFDGIDINMGCPDKAVLKQGSCAALFKTPKLAREIIQATKSHTTVPVSVKIRIGDTKIDWESWVYELLSEEPAAITIHLRTRKEMSKVPAHWEEMPKIVEFITREFGDRRPRIVGNGDVESTEQAREYADTYGCDGVMIGRGAFGKPWMFDSNYPETLEQKFSIAVEHAKLFEQEFSGHKPFEIMKKHFKAYIEGFDGAAELRTKVYECKTADEIASVLAEYLHTLRSQ